MAINRAEWELVFNRALGYARPAVALGGGQARAGDETTIAQAIMRTGTLPQGTLYRDVLTASRRALRAVEAAHILRANPGSPVARGDIPYNRGIYANQSQYQYRVVVTTSAGGRPDPGGMMIVFGSGDRLTRAEIEARALREFRNVPQTRLQDYDRALRAPAAGQTVVAIPVAISRFESLD